VPQALKTSLVRLLELIKQLTCCAMTDSTSMFMRLNSSKQHHEPQPARPLKNLAGGGSERAKAVWAGAIEQQAVTQEC
jgi:hypothetical protein